MAKTKQSGSAAQRRAQERQQRQRREVGRASTPNKGRSSSSGPKMLKKDRTGLYMVLGVLGIIVAFIIAVVIIRNVTSTNLKPAPANQGVLQQLTGVGSSTWETVGTGGVPNPFTTRTGQPALKGSNGLPEFLYVGGEYCPNCAAERWAMINALSRFGTFKNLSQLISYEENIHTFTFEGSSYTSKYVDFVPREIAGNTTDSTGNYVTLDRLTAAQQSIFSKYDSQGTIPFVDIGNKYTLAQASYSFTVLQDSQGNSYDWPTIASALANPSSPITQSIIGTANYMTAAICSVTNQQPGNVCNVAAIQQIEHTIGATTASNGVSSSAVAIAPADLVATQRRVLV